MRYETTTLLQALNDCTALIDENHAETGMPGELRPAWRMYRDLDAIGLSFGLIARDADGLPVGYALVIISPHPHAVDRLFATNDTIYVTPSARALGVGGQLFVRAEREARSRRAVAFQWAVPAGSPLDRALARRCSVSRQITYQREL
ncbi:GNAT family N-acetyltransferase [Sutterella sp.]|uniref:GNAT family N-acetyltransferase n=1 Tax=Sutterella sp. TaxID=1981025 RepID=UPI0026DFF705|nr:GNAT family N-acetyltransferase [Sutterella sp.]MDO5531056.1 hypothetical protein [Sutterella sp.]